ncbi:hypothetical protein AK51_07780 [Serratia nematodiphila DZ0503SBS1]|nr:hypothetical protein AK51_07780 [Serratia nematodiphila DZ0503SBS1]
MQLARQVRLRVQDLFQQRVAGQGTEQAAGGAPVEQRTAEKLQAKRGFFQALLGAFSPLISAVISCQPLSGRGEASG